MGNRPLNKRPKKLPTIFAALMALLMAAAAMTLATMAPAAAEPAAVEFPPLHAAAAPHGAPHTPEKSRDSTPAGAAAPAPVPTSTPAPSKAGDAGTTLANTGASPTLLIVGEAIMLLLVGLAIVASRKHVR